MEASGARAHGNMIDDDAFGIRSANAWTWVAAMLSNAGHAAGAVSVVNAFGSAAGRIWVADVRRNAQTLCMAILNDALGIFAAR